MYEFVHEGLKKNIFQNVKFYNVIFLIIPEVPNANNEALLIIMYIFSLLLSFWNFPISISYDWFTNQIKN